MKTLKDFFSWLTGWKWDRAPKGAPPERAAASTRSEGAAKPKRSSAKRSTAKSRKKP